MEWTLLKKLYGRSTSGFFLGIGLTLFIAIAAKYLSQLPFLSILGQLVISILIGVLWRASAAVPPNIRAGTNFSSKKLLRTGIILLGMRLNLADILHAGPMVFLLAAIHIAFTLAAVYSLSRWFKAGKELAVLTACGTAICGAAAVVAIAAQIKAKDEVTAIAAATVAILGTIFTLIYTLLYPVLGLSPHAYGIFAGSTLHEIAHVIAAAAPAGKNAVDLAVIVKLTRVALLVPVALLIGFFMKSKAPEQSKRDWRKLPVPWFIIGFIAASSVHTLGIFSDYISRFAVLAAYMLIAMAMAGLGLSVDLSAFKRLGLPSFAAGLIGSLLLSFLGYYLIHLFHLV
ncbi:YeiH family protein [Peribacillus sp. B-H-3]|uniref:YeiH family protein n=1 Tax=Peribacillus sp. B-H-3 TaxID=3400420 RepID=UPI003B021F0C